MGADCAALELTTFITPSQPLCFVSGVPLHFRSSALLQGVHLVSAPGHVCGFVPKKRTETNNCKPQPSSDGIALEISARAWFMLVESGAILEAPF